MHITYKTKEYECPFLLAIDLISGKWKALILWYLSQETLRYGELKKHLGKITQKMLTQTLRALEKDKLITRKVYAVVPPKVEYSITKNGSKLIPIFHLLQEWGEEMGEVLLDKNISCKALHVES